LVEDSSTSHAVRLSLSGLHSFYVLQSEDDPHYAAAEMPGTNSGQKFRYRKAKDFGTSIAVRFDPKKREI
jgi:hypothetical protein